MVCPDAKSKRNFFFLGDSQTFEMKQQTKGKQNGERCLMN